MAGTTVRLIGNPASAFTSPTFYDDTGTSQTDYLPLGSGGLTTINTARGTEANSQVTWRTAGTLTNLFGRVGGGTNYVAATLKTRIGGVNGNLTITVSAAGTVEDTTHSDAISAGNAVCLQYFNGSQAIVSAFGWELFHTGASWAATNDTVNRLVTGGPQTFSTASQTSYIQPGGLLAPSTTQTAGEWKVKLPTGVDHITFRNLFVRVSANTTTTPGTNTFSVTINGATGTGTAPSITINAAGAAVYEDTSNTIQAKNGDNISIKVVTPGAGTPSCTVEVITIEAQSSDGLFHWITTDVAAGDDLNGGEFSLNGRVSYLTGPGFGLVKLPNTVMSLMSANIQTAVAGSSITLQQSTSNVGSPGNVSISGAATGWVTDSTNTYTAASTDVMRYYVSAHDIAVYAMAITLQTPAADGSGTLTTVTTGVGASSTGNTIVFTYTATGFIGGGSVTLVVPSGWSAPSTTGANNGYTTATSTGSIGTLSVASQTITIPSVTLQNGQTITITYGNTGSGGLGATATSSPGAQTWQAQEKSTSGGTLTNLGASPSINVYAADGSGTLTTGTSTVVSHSDGNSITFTYTAATGGIGAGAVTLVVPGGWSAPSTTTSANGYTTATAGSVSVGGQTITVSSVTLGSGSTFNITYGSTASGGLGATAAAGTGAQTWQAQEESTSAGTLTNLGASPSITLVSNNKLLPSNHMRPHPFSPGLAR